MYWNSLYFLEGASCEMDCSRMYSTSTVGASALCNNTNALLVEPANVANSSSSSFDLTCNNDTQSLVSHYICPSVCTFIYTYFYLSIYLYVYLYVFLSVWIYVLLSVRLYVSLPVYLSVCLSVRWPVCMLVCLSVCL